MQSSFVDLEEVVTEWAWRLFSAVASRAEKKLGREALQIQVSWAKVNISHAEPVFSPGARFGTPTSKVVFSTSFDNHTDGEQEYNFRAERTVRSSCSVEMSKGVTKGVDMSLTLKLPMEVLDVGVGFSKQVEVTKTSGEVFETEMTWSAESTIKVPAKTRINAELLVTQRDYTGTFDVVSTLMGRVLVTVTNKKDNNSFLRSLEGDVAEIFRGMQGFIIEGKMVKTTSRGSCKLQMGVQQQVVIKEEPLPVDSTGS